MTKVRDESVRGHAAQFEDIDEDSPYTPGTGFISAACGAGDHRERNGSTWWRTPLPVAACCPEANALTRCHLVARESNTPGFKAMVIRFEARTPDADHGAAEASAPQVAKTAP